ncbi:hypothetical protein DPMN_117727 [Dreissena polymorpha]|uniref:Uncharacterized protein n=1 Tax=Dreissena polymorpha TaxID=45954 RepID=A0A9D4JL91_DREPO|nr:hypothetical protein DPMN_117727 [Dreissena polymorpha]
MMNSTNNTSAVSTMNSEKLEEVSSYKYLAATLSKIGTITAKTTPALARRQK